MFFAKLADGTIRAVGTGSLAKASAEIDKIMVEIEETLVEFEKTFEIVNKYSLGGVDLAREKKAKSDEEKLTDFLRNLEKMF